ncbi:MAG TPA: 3D domain-containing protein [Gaiellaceae bacterium]
MRALLRWLPGPLAAVACAACLGLPGATAASPTPKLQKLRLDAATIEHERRSAVLSLYSLDARLTTANNRFDSLQRREAALRHQRAVLEVELRLANVDTHRSQLRLAERLRSLYDQGGVSTLDAIFGAQSISDIVTSLDNLDHVTSVNDQILLQLRTAQRRELRARVGLNAREAALESAIRSAGAEARTLASVRSARTSYVTSLTSRESLDASQIATLEAQARAAETKSAQLTQTPPAATLAVVVSTPTSRSTSTAGSLTVVSTGYCLTGTTATGIPVGWGVAAVDPGVIPLGSHLTIPGYGEAVAADTGSAIVGDRIDLWFPSCAQASGWGSRSVTIALH